MEIRLICERCGMLHPADYDGLRCKSDTCQGRLIEIRITQDNHKRWKKMQERRRKDERERKEPE